MVGLKSQRSHPFEARVHLNAVRSSVITQLLLGQLGVVSEFVKVSARLSQQNGFNVLLFVFRTQPFRQYAVALQCNGLFEVACFDLSGGPLEQVSDGNDCVLNEDLLAESISSELVDHPEHVLLQFLGVVDKRYSFGENVDSVLRGNFVHEDLHEPVSECFGEILAT